MEIIVNGSLLNLDNCKVAVCLNDEEIRHVGGALLTRGSKYPASSRITITQFPEGLSEDEQLEYIQYIKDGVKND